MSSEQLRNLGHALQVWSLDVDPREQLLAVGGAGPKLHLYRIAAAAARSTDAAAPQDGEEGAGASGRRPSSRQARSCSLQASAVFQN